MSTNSAFQCAPFRALTATLVAAGLLCATSAMAQPAPSSSAAPVNTAPAGGPPSASAQPIALLSLAEVSKMPLPPPGVVIAYGSGAQQYGELRLPHGVGPFPVVMLIHGGCWRSAVDLAYFSHLAVWLTGQGFATWNIEFRRLGDEGGGWPGTFTDVGMATDALRTIAKAVPLDLNHVFAAGHSAGGQLALWLAARPKLAADSELFVDKPQPIRGVLGLAAITDMDTYRFGSPTSCNASVEKVLGGTPESVPRRYADTSPRRLLPIGVPQVFIQGDADPIVEPASVRDYVAAATAAGDRAAVIPLAGMGHFETAIPLMRSYVALRDAVRELVESAK
ncbi:MAG: hypothetical protein JWQ11_2895 [Rhizobacter sp.]|nr:hypothetical protein [Rhizobacter sp.]